MIVVNHLFSFKEQRIITEDEYQELKYLLKSNPDFDFLSKLNFYDERKGIILFVLIGFPLSLMIMSIKKEGINVFIGGLVMLASMIFGLFILLPEYSSYLKAKVKMKKYFNKLKQDVINSNSYNDFLKKHSEV